MQKTSMLNSNNMKNERIYFFDNAKFIIIFLVVLGHAITMLQKAPVFNGLFSFIYTFHMPVMVFITGYFAKNYMKKTNRAQRPIAFLVLYIVFQVLLILFKRYVLLDTGARYTVVKPQFGLWYLQCLVGWYIILPVLDSFKPKTVLVGSLLIGLLIGYDGYANPILSGSRFFVYLPFFMCGYYITYERIQKLLTIKWRIAGIVVLVAGAIFFYINPDIFSLNALMGNTPYKQLDLPWGKSLSWAYRLIIYAINGVVSVAFLAVIPKMKTWFSKLGTRTIAVYLLHSFLYLAYKDLKWYKAFNTEWMHVLIVVICLAVTVILSLKPFFNPINAIMNIRKDVKSK